MSTPSPTHVAPSQRLVSLDVLRGLTIAGMILVTDPGTYSAVYWPLLHANWNNPTPTDLIFPLFLIIVGVSMTFSFASRLARGATRRRLFFHVLERSVLLIVLGLLVNGFPDYDLHTLRFCGILQRIGVCYFLASVLYLAATRTASGISSSQRRRTITLSTTAILLLAAYWIILKRIPVPGFGPGHLDSLGSLPTWLDRRVFGLPHLWPYGLTPGHGVTYDPEGILSTLGALATTLLGALAGDWFHTRRSASKKTLGLFLAGIALLAISFALSHWMPLNKKIWTPTFALYSAGFSITALAFFYAVIDIKRWRSWTPTILIFGTNAIFAFVLSTVVTNLSDRIHIGGDATTLHHWLYANLFATWMQPIHASLAYAILIVAFNLALVYPLYRKRLFLRV